jgi:hypothetical protein
MKSDAVSVKMAMEKQVLFNGNKKKLIKIFFS